MLSKQVSRDLKTKSESALGTVLEQNDASFAFVIQIPAWEGICKCLWKQLNYTSRKHEVVSQEYNDSIQNLEDLQHELPVKDG